MSETEYGEQRSASGAFIAVVGVALLAAVGALVWCYALQSHLGATEQKLAVQQQQNVDLQAKLNATNARLRATSETLGQSVGMTQRQIELRTQSILATQKAESARLEQQQAATNKEIGAAGVMSGLIATNHGELEELKHRGDRNYFEFTLQKGAKPTLLSTIKLQAKKVDEKKSRYTLVVSADDRNIEKKDRNLDEPVQFYTGKDPVLYELVVNSIEKNRISGYLSTPKSPQHPSGSSE